jgi:anaerobic selenocysteine-containing dehydrogenase
MTNQSVFRTCTLCEATCGIEVRVENGVATRITGDRDDPFSRGHICPKAHGLLDLHADPDRLRQPIRRTASGWQQIGWDEAYDLAAEGLAAVRDAHGVDAIALYRGNPTIHDMASILYWNVVQQALPTPNKFSAGSVDTWPRYVQAGSMFGGMLHIPVPDLERTDHLLVLGANPVVSNGSLMTAPDVKKRLQEIRGRGGKIVVIDPRRSETADIADEHYFITPGGDAAFVLAMIHTLFADDAIDLGRCADFANGLDALPELVSAFSPEAVSAACGIDADSTRRMAREFSAAPSAVCYGRMGTCVQEFGTLASWAIELLNVLTGNLDRPGGAMFTNPAVSLDFAVSLGAGDVEFGRHSSRAAQHDEIFGEFPVVALAEEIEAAGDGRVRALMTIAGNPVVSFPNASRLSGALDSLDFMVSLDYYVNETTRHADVIIPPLAPLANPTFDVALNHFAIRNVAKFSEPAVLAEPGLRPIWQTALEISKRVMGLDDWDFDRLDALAIGQFAKQALDASPLGERVTPEQAVAVLGDEPGPVRLLDLLLRVGPHGDGFGERPGGLAVEKLREQPHGIDLGALTPMLPDKLATSDRRIHLAPERITRDLPRLQQWIERRNAAQDSQWLLIGRRDVRSMNSWLHNLPSLAKGKPRCTLQLHPDDARQLQLEDGDEAQITGRVGEITAPVEISGRLMRGVVSLPHGWGHDLPGTEMGVARKQPGVNINEVVDDATLDVPSGTSVLNGIPVQVAAATPR